MCLPEPITEECLRISRKCTHISSLLKTGHFPTLDLSLSFPSFLPPFLPSPVSPTFLLSLYIDIYNIYVIYIFYMDKPQWWATSSFADYNVAVFINTEPWCSISWSSFCVGGFGLTCNSVISIAFKGISLKAAAASIKKESEDPNYYQYNMQGNTIL